MRRLLGSNLFWLVAYALCASLLVVTLVQARSRVIAELGSAENIAEWKRWTSDTAREQSQPNPRVARRIPSADEPPLLIILRDSFPAVVATSLVTTSMLFLFLMLIIRGMARAPSTPAGLSSDKPE